MTRFYKMRIAFNGANYAGWQRQPGSATVQQAVEETLRNLFSEDRLAVASSSRTDAGVHALDMTLSFSSERSFPENELAAVLKRRLPHDIRLLEIIGVSSAFHAHRNALAKAYVYAIQTGEPDIFLKGLCWNWRNTPVNGELRRAVKMISGTHDFRSFTGRKTESDTVRTIYRAELMQFGSLCCFYISGDGFLYKMVRRLTGFLYETAQGRHTAGDLAALLERPECPPDDVTVAPPEGLYLKKVFYNPEEWRQDTLTAPPFLL